jgi:hypothetical protein
MGRGSLSQGPERVREARAAKVHQHRAFLGPLRAIRGDLVFPVDELRLAAVALDQFGDIVLPAAVALGDALGDLAGCLLELDERRRIEADRNARFTGRGSAVAVKTSSWRAGGVGHASAPQGSRR